MYQRILVPLDGSPTSLHGLAEAIRLARLTHGRLRLVHVIDDMSFAIGMDAYAGYAADWLTLLRENGKQLLAAARDQVEAAGLPVDTALYDSFAGSVNELVCAEARKWPADLIVLGSHGRRGVSRLVLGSSAESILRHATVPVLLVRDPDAAERVAPAVDAAVAADKAAVPAVTAVPAKAAQHVHLPSAALRIE